MATTAVITTLTRDQIVAKYTRDYALRQPAADVGPGTQPFLDATTFADQQQVVYADAVIIGGKTNVRTTFGADLDELGEAEGVFRAQASGASGYVTCQASSGGTTIVAGDEIKDATGTGLRFTCSATKLYQDGDPVAISGLDTGPATNLPAGLVLQWQNPRAGCGPNAAILAQFDGSGLSEGRDVESDAQYQDRIIFKRSNPPASGNDAAYQAAVEQTAGLSVEACFTVTCIKGPGTTGVMFTMRPALGGGSRIPNGAQIAQVEANLKSQFPADDGIFPCALIAQPVATVIKVTWSAAASGWTDAAPWPPYIPGDPVIVDVGGALGPLGFRLTTGTSTTTPQPGQTIGVFNVAVDVFEAKRILTVTPIVSGKSWDLVFDTTNGASDTTFTPAAGAMASPWSDSLTGVVAPIAGYFDTLGPGEQVATFFDPGMRQRRQPASLSIFPSTISNRLIRPVQDLPTVSDADLILPAVPFATTVGTPGVSSNLLELGDLAAFPQ